VARVGVLFHLCQFPRRGNNTVYYDPDFVRENMGYDPETGLLTWKVRKQGRVLGKPIGKFDKDGYLVVSYSENGRKDGRKKRFCVHRIIWVWVHGKEPEDQLDHINGNKSDNRLCNLREADTKQNMRNVGKQAHNTSGLKGVSWHKLRNKWRADIKVDQKQVFLGLYDCIAAASLAYQVAADTHHGEFARAF